MEKLKYVLIGCGRIAHRHLQAAQMLEKKEELHISALCDLCPAAMQEKKERYQLLGVTLYTDYRQMILCEKPDLVAIATESGSHGEIALFCLQQHCHVIVEKPMALSLQQSDNMIELAEQNNCRLAVCHQNRFNPAVQLLHHAVAQGQLGHIFYVAAAVRWHRDEQYYRQAPWRGTWRQDGGALMNQCIHNLDLMRWLLGGCLCTVSAEIDRQAHPYIEGEDVGFGLFAGTNGSYGIFEGTTNIYCENLEETLCVFGERGTVKLGGKAVDQIEFWQVENSKESAQTLLRYCSGGTDIYGNGHIVLYQDMLRAIEKGTAPYVSGQVGRQAVEMVLAMYQSAATGKKVAFPLEKHAACWSYAEYFRQAAKKGVAVL